jgi:hypothetical protein
MAKRVQVTDQLAQAPTLTPTARPFDTFVMPGAPRQGNGLKDLADALGTLHKPLLQFAAQEVERISDEEAAAGARAYLENRKGFKEAIEAGIIPAGASPHFIQAYKDQEVRARGYDFELAFRDEYEKSGLVNQDDPAAVQAFAADFTKKWMADNLADYDDISVAKNFIPVAEQTTNSILARHAEERAAIVEQGLIESAEREIIGMIDRGGDPAEIGMAITMRSRELIDSGLNGTKANKLIVDAITNAAIDKMDYSVLDLLDQIDTGNGKISGIGYARDQREAAEDKITADIRAAETHEWQRQERFREARSRELSGAAMKALIADPSADVSGIMTELTAINPSAAASIGSFKEAQLSAAFRIHERPEVVAGVYGEVRANPDRAVEIAAAAGAARLIAPNTVESVIRYGESIERNKDVFESDEWRDAERFLTDSITGGDLGATAESRQLADEAVQEMEDEAMEWVQKNRREDGSFDRFALRKHLREVRKRILRDPFYGASDTRALLDEQRSAASPAENPADNPFNNPAFQQ